MRKTVIFVFALFFFVGCEKKQSPDEHAGHQVEAPAKKYTCSMHPQIVQDKPGTCPICGMTLVELSTSAKDNELMLSDTQMRLANITTRRASKKPVGETIVLNGTLAVDQQRSEVISSRSEGRIEKLFIKETGQPVVKGQALYVLYSESLLTLQQEYLLAKEQYETLGKTESRYKSFLDAAERKLLLYGLSRSQIEQLDKNALRAEVTFLSPATGIVTEIDATEGQYVDEGSALYKIEDISSLWVEAELYPGEASLVKRGDKVSVSVNGFGSAPIETTVTFLNPEFKAGTQILLMRAEIKNPGIQFKPGQQVQIFFTHSSRNAIAIPVDAVIRDGKGAHVYVQSGRNTFAPRMVQTGLEGFDQVEITEGLSESDTVAITGAYLLYSELVLKKGTDPMAGHQH
jgi:Cu(I)/Ag(I) efflux system membrane fusion protein